MLRRFTQDVGRYRKGSLHDYPVFVWRQIAKDVGLPLEQFTAEAEINALLQNPLKGRVRIHKRLGSTQ